MKKFYQKHNIKQVPIMTAKTQAFLSKTLQLRSGLNFVLISQKVECRDNSFAKINILYPQAKLSGQ